MAAMLDFFSYNEPIIMQYKFAKDHTLKFHCSISKYMNLPTESQDMEKYF